LTAGGTAALAEVTTSNVGKKLEVTLDGDVIAEPWVLAPILEGKFKINISGEAVRRRFLTAASGDC